MKAKTSLRIAGILLLLLLLLHTAGHAVGALTWKDAPNARVAAVIAGMQNEHFPLIGRSLTITSFYEGYGFTMIGVLLMLSLLLWTFAAHPVRQMILVLGLFLLFLGVIELIYFFPFAAAFSLLAGIFTLYVYLPRMENTRTIFQLMTENNQTVLHFNHDGLTPEKQCYALCLEGGNTVIKNYLFYLITHNKSHF